MFAPKTATSSTARKTADSASRSRVAFSFRVSATGDRARDGPNGRNVDPVIGRSGSWDFGSVTVFSLGQHDGYQQPYSSRSSRPRQPALAVAPASDPLEREADAVADQIMRRPERAPSISAAQVPHQLEVGAENTQSRGSKKTGKPKPAVNGAIIDLLRSAGRPLDSRLRDFMESRFRRDFSQVRVHDDALGASAARGLMRVQLRPAVTSLFLSLLTNRARHGAICWLMN